MQCTASSMDCTEALRENQGFAPWLQMWGCKSVLGSQKSELRFCPCNERAGVHGGWDEALEYGQNDPSGQARRNLPKSPAAKLLVGKKLGITSTAESDREWAESSAVYTSCCLPKRGQPPMGGKMAQQNCPFLIERKMGYFNHKWNSIPLFVFPFVLYLMCSQEVNDSFSSLTVCSSLRLCLVLFFCLLFWGGLGCFSLFIQQTCANIWINLKLRQDTATSVAIAVENILLNLLMLPTIAVKTSFINSSRIYFCL